MRRLFPLILLLLGGCALRQGMPDVVYGSSSEIPIVYPRVDHNRWYVWLETQSFGPRLFFFDTGYANTTCDDDFAKDIGADVRGHARVHGETGSAKAQKAVLPNFFVGDHEIQGLVCTVRDLHTTSSIRDSSEVPIAGVLGMDVLRRFRMRIDPQAALLVLDNPEETPPIPRIGEGITKLRREYGTGLRATVTVHAQGHRKWIIIDTGASITLMNTRFVDGSPVSFIKRTQVIGTGGKAKKSKGKRDIPIFQIDDFSVDSQSPRPSRIHDRRRGPFMRGLLGLNILGYYIQEYDFGSRRLRLVPIERPNIPSWQRYQKMLSESP